MADCHSFKKIFSTAVPVRRADGKNATVILSALPRYTVAKCCDKEDHIRNFEGRTYAKMIGSTLADLTDWLEDLS